MLSWDTGPTNVYYSYSRGFKSGGLFTPAFNDSDGVTSEKIFSHEVGVKNRALDGRLETNLAVFYSKNTNLQTTIIDPLRGGSLAVNAGAVKTYGAEIDMQFRPVEGVSLAAAGSYLHAEYQSFPNALVKCLDTTPAGAVFPNSPLFNCTQDLRGVTTPHSPRWTASFSAAYDFSIGSWSANLAALARYQSAISFFPLGEPDRPVLYAGTGHTTGTPLRYDRQTGYTLVNISGYVSPPGGNIRLGFYVNNLLDKKYANYRNTSAPFGLTYAAAKPITYGIRAEYKF